MNVNRPMEGRNHSIDLLRIVFMILVVMLHINLFGGLIKNANGSENILFKFMVNFNEEISIIAVNVLSVHGSYLRVKLIH